MKGDDAMKCYSSNCSAFVYLLVLSMIFLVGAPASSQIQGDEFNSTNLGSQWTFVNPLGDASSFACTGTNVEISPIAGADHAILGGAGNNNAPRIMQIVSDPQFFDIYVKFDLGVSTQYQEQGILIWEDDDNLLRLEFYSDGASTYVLATKVIDGVFASPGTAAIAPSGSAPLYMRVKRTGDKWSQYYSTNGTDWTSFFVDTTIDTLYVNQVGVYAGNEVGSSSPAFTASIDYFRTNDPLPIQLGSIAATVVSQSEVRVDWITVTETNNYGFEVQKSAETPANYQTIPNSFVAGHGTTIQPHSYTYTDGAASPGIWYYRLKQIDLDGTIHYTEGVQLDIVTGVEEKEIPTVFALDQNYPNPFNPSTVIEFALPKEEHVVLEVYNLLGQRVATLVNEVRPTGYYAVPFNAEGMASGLYFYRLYTTEISLLKKMVLLK